MVLLGIIFVLSIWTVINTLVLVVYGACCTAEGHCKGLRRAQLGHPASWDKNLAKKMLEAMKVVQASGTAVLT